MPLHFNHLDGYEPNLSGMQRFWRLISNHLYVLTLVVYYCSEVLFCLLIVPIELNFLKNDINKVLILGGAMSWVCVGLTMANLGIVVFYDLFYRGLHIVRRGVIADMMLHSVAQTIAQLVSGTKYAFMSAIEKSFNLDETTVRWCFRRKFGWKRFLLIKLPRFVLNASVVRSYVRYVTYRQHPDLVSFNRDPMLLFVGIIIGIQSMTFVAECFRKVTAIILYVTAVRKVMANSGFKTMRDFIYAAIEMRGQIALKQQNSTSVLSHTSSGLGPSSSTSSAFAGYTPSVVSPKRYSSRVWGSFKSPVETISSLYSPPATPRSFGQVKTGNMRFDSSSTREDIQDTRYKSAFQPSFDEYFYGGYPENRKDTF